MGEPRRRGGRGRSGRGGRIPRRGEAGSTSAGLDETFMGFPEVSGPLRSPTVVDEAAVERLLGQVLARERRLVQTLRAAAPAAPDPSLGDVLLQVERHRDVLGQLARDLGADLGAGDEGGQAAADGQDPWGLVAEQRMAHLGWLTLQRVAYASGDRRIDRVVKPVLREKERHNEVLETHALRLAGRSLFREPEE